MIVVTGAGGQVGRALSRLLPEGRFLTRELLDVTDGDAVQAAAADAEIVVHLAAMTDVDGCEEVPDLAHLINSKGTGNIAAAAVSMGARLIYVSTDYVFDGADTGEYRETDSPAPLNVYGRTKLEGEVETTSVPNHLIIRSSWIFGQGQNFINTILSRAKEGQPLRVVGDQVARPTSAVAVARAIAFLLRSDVTGVLHVAGDGPPCSWADLAEHALAVAEVQGEVHRITSDSYRQNAQHPVAHRPANSTLSLDRARSLKVPLLDWRESVRDHVRSVA